MQTLEPILAAHPFLKDLAPRHLAVLVGCASNVRFDAGQFLFHEGEEANHFYIVRRGRVALEIAAPGRAPIVIQTIGEGEVLGWSWLLPPYRWHFDARAVELTRAIALDGGCLRTRCEEDHDLGYELLKRFAAVVVDRLQATRLQLMDVYGTPSRKASDAG
ncbi:MAG: cyclic nucleotide-binding domain-containing protein [Chloroflexota bacterium]|nr:cyclic nucleotide-binding domain-containing protein [Chloroflexota bacterium]